MTGTKTEIARARRLAMRAAQILRDGENEMIARTPRLKEDAGRLKILALADILDTYTGEAAHVIALLGGLRYGDHYPSNAVAIFKRIRETKDKPEVTGDLGYRLLHTLYPMCKD